MELLQQIGPREVGWFLAVLAAIHALFVLSWWFWKEPDISTHFSPKGGCTEAIVAELTQARREILVQAYSFTCPSIAQALIDAAARRVRVVILLDKSNEQESYSELGDMEKHGMNVWVDSEHAIAHNKIMIVDSKVVITGSFNFTRQAENSNAENLIILRHHKKLVARYRANFHAHREHCHSPGGEKVPAEPEKGHFFRHAATHTR